jgi:hypothetical protein
LWEKGVEVYDGYRKEHFNLRAMLFGTINDFPAYGNLSGYSIKGQLACPICEENTDWMRLEKCKKMYFSVIVDSYLLIITTVGGGKHSMENQNIVELLYH